MIALFVFGDLGMEIAITLEVSQSSQPWSRKKYYGILPRAKHPQDLSYELLGDGIAHTLATFIFRYKLDLLF